MYAAASRRTLRITKAEIAFCDSSSRFKTGTHAFVPTVTPAEVMRWITHAPKTNHLGYVFRRRQALLAHGTNRRTTAFSPAGKSFVGVRFLVHRLTGTYHRMAGADFGVLVICSPLPFAMYALHDSPTANFLPSAEPGDIRFHHAAFNPRVTRVRAVRSHTGRAAPHPTFQAELAALAVPFVAKAVSHR